MNKHTMAGSVERIDMSGIGIMHSVMIVFIFVSLYGYPICNIRKYSGKESANYVL